MAEGVVDDTQLAALMCSCSALQPRTGKNMSSSMDMTKVFAVLRPSAAARSPSVGWATLPRCHFHAMASRSLGSMTVRRLQEALQERVLRVELQRAPDLLLPELR